MTPIPVFLLDLPVSILCLRAKVRVSEMMVGMSAVAHCKGATQLLLKGRNRTLEITRQPTPTEAQLPSSPAATLRMHDNYLPADDGFLNSRT